MKQLSFNIPGAVITYNYLYDHMPFDWREEDLLFIRLPNKELIDVGWYPACDPTGYFKVTLSDSTQNQIAAIRVRNLDQIVEIVEGLAVPTQHAPMTSVSMDYRGLTQSAANSSSSSVLIYPSNPFSTVSVKTMVA